jgi:hypothetical protein
MTCIKSRPVKLSGVATWRVPGLLICQEGNLRADHFHLFHVE